MCPPDGWIDLVNEGYHVYVPADAVVSRRELDWEKGMELMDKAGAVIGTDRRRSVTYAARARGDGRVQADLEAREVKVEGLSPPSYPSPLKGEGINKNSGTGRP